MRSIEEDFLPCNGKKNKIKSLEKCRKDQNINDDNKLWKSKLFHKVKKTVYVCDITIIILM